MIDQLRYPEELPVSKARLEIVSAIRDHQVVIIAGDTGSGKSTQLPKMCFEAGRGRRRMIGCTQPRRLAATSVAARVAEELGPDGHHLVGCKIRFNDRTTKATRLKFMSDGILLAEARRDRFLNAYDTIIVDEAHERSLNIDFLIGILRRLLNRRKDLKVIITSATIDTVKFAEAFAGAPIITVGGRMYPVETRYLPPVTADTEETSPVELAVTSVLDLCRHGEAGDVLVFMPTERDIRETVESLEKALVLATEVKSAVVVMPLFGRLSEREQNRIFRSVSGRKIVVATNVAETSITVPGIRYVVDSGLARISVYNPRARTSKLPILPISRASADQRKGRCGRTGPGICIRLYSEEEFLGRDEFTRPEIQRADLSEVILRMLFLGLGDPHRFPFIDPPTPRSIRDGYQLLWELKAIQCRSGDWAHARLTDQGRLMARLPLDPRISRMIIEARDKLALREVVVIAAALSIADPRIRPTDQEAAADQAHALFEIGGSDFLAFLKIWEEMIKVDSTSQLRKFCKRNFLSFQRVREWQDIHEQIMRILKGEGGFPLNIEPASPVAIHQALLSGSLRNIALRKAKNIYQGTLDKEVMVFPGSALFNKAGKWVMAAELIETSRLFARCVATIDPEWLEPLATHLCRSSYAEPHWEKKRGQVVAYQNVTLFGLLIVAKRKVNYGPVDPDECRMLFIQQGLLEGELNGRHPFLQHNLDLVANLLGLEDRVRQRDILVDDATLYRFYDDRLSPGICDQPGLIRAVRRSGSDDFLRMRRGDILQQKPAADQLEVFPERLTLGGMEFSVSYRFEPGAEDDGVTVRVPVDLISSIEPAAFDWLVPGLLVEKVTFLIKGLPKSLRKKLVPVPETARALAAELDFGQGGFLARLQELIFRRYQVVVERGDWIKDELPHHLRMRHCLIGRDGNILKSSRDFGELLGGPRSKSSGNERVAELRNQWERDQVTSWDFADLPERIPVQDRTGLLTGFLWPGLMDTGEGALKVRLFSTAAESHEQTRQGLLVLYGNFFNKFKGVAKDFALGNDLWALYEGLGSKIEFNVQLARFVLEEIFATRSGRIPDRECFSATIDQVKAEGLFRLGRSLVEMVVTVLRKRRATLDLINRFEAMDQGRGRLQFLDFQEHLLIVLPVDFLSTFDRRRLQATGRYLQALRIRVERAYADPAKDLLRAQQVRPFAERLKNFQTPLGVGEGHLRLIEEYCEMLDEFRVSIFAQEIKTPFPVSGKRLEKKWHEIMASLS
ncbi:MAG: ATP-dependent RNA helicase HrpA [Proteobacteria bacterium]|nr:ATP-dependent RNA helicase HrpA [Pseudomonadota bacterium]MBU1687774.1 ATP-dependent RNA helicase HrpA [Pseudomonadota bacterium]